MLGLSRNTWFGLGGVLLAVALYLGFSKADDEQGADESGDAVAADKKGGHKRGKKRSKKPAAAADGGLGAGKMCARLDCSEAQLGALKSMLKEHRSQTSGNRRALAEANAKIAAELAEAELDVAALDDAFASAATEQSAIDANARAVLESLHGELNEPQREALAKMVARHGPTMLLARPASDSKRRGGGNRKGRKRGRGGRSAGGSLQGMTAGDPARAGGLNAKNAKVDAQSNRARPSLAPPSGEMDDGPGEPDQPDDEPAADGATE